MYGGSLVGAGLGSYSTGTFFGNEGGIFLTQYGKDLYQYSLSKLKDII